MENALLVLTRETTIWKAWIGFNASHSLGIILFGAIYGYLAFAHNQWLLRSGFLLLTGLITLTAYAYLGKRYLWPARTTAHVHQFGTSNRSIPHAGGRFCPP